MESDFFHALFSKNWMSFFLDSFMGLGAHVPYLGGHTIYPCKNNKEFFFIRLSISTKPDPSNHCQHGKHTLLCVCCFSHIITTHCNEKRTCCPALIAATTIALQNEKKTKTTKIQLAARIFSHIDLTSYFSGV